LLIVGEQSEVICIWIPFFCPSVVRLITQSMKRRNRNGNRRHPYHTPDLTSK
jgi:hypothetical protein